MFKRILTSALVFGMAALAPPAAAQMICGPRPAITNWLTTSFGESRSAVGMIGQDRVLELWVAAETDSWTILVTRPDSISCVVAGGTNWIEVNPRSDQAPASRWFLRQD